MDEDETITHTAIFDDWVEMDIKVCGVQYDENTDNNNAWTEAVLYDENGYEIAFTEPQDDYFGEWRIASDNDIYVANVKKEKNKG